MYTREAFVEDVLYSIPHEDIPRLFGVSAEELKNGAWNANLEIVYQQTVTE